MLKITVTSQEDVCENDAGTHPQDLGEDSLQLSALLAVITSDVWVHQDARYPDVQFVKKDRFGNRQVSKISTDSAVAAATELFANVK